MLENLYTTKMSANKKNLQNRFTKIRSKNGRLAKIMALVMSVAIAAEAFDMKKIISLIITLTLLCSIGITAFAAENEIVGGKITLTQFLGTDRDNTKSVAIYLPDEEQAITVDKDKFFDISDIMMLTSSLDPVPIDLSGTYITAEKNDGTSAYAFIGEAGGVDKYSQLMRRNPYALYTVDSLSLIDSLLSLAQNTSDTAFSDIKGPWAEDVINKWHEKGIVSGYPDGTFKPDNSVTRAELAKILTLAFDLQPSEFVYTPEEISANAWYYNYLLCAGKYIPVYALPESNEKNQPYVDNENVNWFLPEQNAMRMHVAETLVGIKKDKEKINVELPVIQDIKAELEAKFKTDGYFRPYDKVTRAELLTMVDRMLQK